MLISPKKPSAYESMRRRSHRIRRHGRKSLSVGATIAFGLGASLLATPVFLRLTASASWRVQGLNDYLTHLFIADQVSWWPFFPVAPHFLLHVASRALAIAMSLPVAMTTALAVSVFLTAVVIVRFGEPLSPADRGLSPLGIAALALGFLVADAPGALLSQLDGLGAAQVYWPLRMWGNPTSMFAIPFNLLFTWYAIRLLEQEQAPSGWRPDLGFTAVTLLSLLAKPNFVMAALPAFVLCLAVKRSLGPDQRRWLLSTLVAPAVIVLCWQLWFMTQRVPEEEMDFGLAVAPLRFASNLGIWHPTTWLVFWPVLIACAIGGRRYLAAPGVKFSLVSLALASIPMLVLIETSEQAGGNIAFGFLMTVPIVYLTTLRFLISELLTDPRPASGPKQLFLAVFACSFGIGIVAGCYVLLEAYGWIG